METGKADYPRISIETIRQDAVLRLEAWKEAANSLANLHPYEWAELYKASLERRGLTN